MSQELVLAAREAAKNAYCKYSNFHVGAAVKTTEGEIILGNNIENASYGLTICAERVAIFNAISSGKKIVEIALSCADALDSADDSLKMPCGACRQVMAEFLPATAKVHVDAVRTFELRELLPHSFVLSDG